MTIYVLTLLACLTGQPDRCERVELEVQSCNAAGIGQLAMWAIRHPEWQVTKWHCGEGVST
jgi:hypothetical protein